MNGLVKVLGRVGFTVAAVLSVLIALVSYRFLPQGVETAMDFMAHHVQDNALMLYAHIGVAPIALAVMPFQFLKNLRARRPAVHRWLGRIHVAAILVSGVAGFQLAFYTSAGPFAAAGFAILAVIWLSTTGMAFYFALKRQIDLHRIWMLRSAALTFAAVTLRVYLGAATAAGIDFDTAYLLVSWLAWVPNALVMEAYLWTRRGSSRRIAASEPQPT
ncbi:DUF2306 domain-containing protein [Roseibium sediminicola]|uniref:DUF2306 domain-containing protein n=1 Tax=Roseibium sediminicola TaxID=2933272 RepID=A0ABT0GRS8_9HYPH|nr:DUF2306 domain-containing protein [Roseibium sp. CAU 1639]MCK7612154.1 DUF2306 domain-containing protein [Roseibium sp. CAU 1639]